LVPVVPVEEEPLLLAAAATATAAATPTAITLALMPAVRPAAPAPAPAPAPPAVLVVDVVVPAPEEADSCWACENKGAAAKLAVRTRAMVWRSFMIFPSRKRTVSKKMGWQAWG
jgi:hypothetical protein